jgi:hypothetical protein
VEKRNHERPEQGLPGTNDEGRVLLDGEAPHQKADEGFDEHVDAPRAIGYVHGQPESGPRERAALPSLPERVPANEEEHGVRIGAVDAESAHDEPLHQKYSGGDEKSAGGGRHAVGTLQSENAVPGAGPGQSPQDGGVVSSRTMSSIVRVIWLDGPV